MSDIDAMVADLTELADLAAPDHRPARRGVGRAEDRPVHWHGKDEGRAFAVCTCCGGELDRLGPGQWVARYPSREVVGYHLTKLFSHITALREVVRALNTADETRRRETTHQDLGVPSGPPEALQALEGEVALADRVKGRCRASTGRRSAPGTCGGRCGWAATRPASRWGRTGRCGGCWTPSRTTVTSAPSTGRIHRGGATHRWASCCAPPAGRCRATAPRATATAAVTWRRRDRWEDGGGCKRYKKRKNLVDNAYFV